MTRIENSAKLKRLTRIEQYAFIYCRSLTSIDLSECVKLTKIERYAFRCCDAMRSVRLPDSVTEIGMGTFFSCFSLKDVAIPCKVTVISHSLLRRCKSLQHIRIPPNVTKIEEVAFGDCTSLKSLTFAPQGECSVKFLGSNFLGDTNLKTFTLPSSVTSMAVDALDYLCNPKMIRILLPWGQTEDGPFQSQQYPQFFVKCYPKLVLTMAFVLLQRAGKACGVPLHRMHKCDDAYTPTAAELVNVLVALLESTEFAIPKYDAPDVEDSDDNAADSEGSVDPDDSSLAGDNDPRDDDDSDHSDWDPDDSIDEDSRDSEGPEDPDSLDDAQDSDHAEPKPDDCIDHDNSAEDHHDRVVTQAIYLLLKTFPSEFFGNGGDHHQVMDVHSVDAASAVDPLGANISASPRDPPEEEGSTAHRSC
jgi:BspA type Leucine rich repeat region (6 copies)